MCMYVSEISAEGIFVSFPWWLKNVKNRSKIALFSNERHFEIWFPKKIIITFFGRKLFKLHKKETILHVTISFFLKQRETRTSSGPISHPLSIYHCSGFLPYIKALLQNLRIMSSKWHLFSTSGGISSSPRLFPSVMTFLAFSYSSWSKASVLMSNSGENIVNHFLLICDDWWVTKQLLEMRVPWLQSFILGFSSNLTFSCSSAPADFIYKVPSSFMLAVLVSLLNQLDLLIKNLLVNIIIYFVQKILLRLHIWSWHAWSFLDVHTFSYL